MTPSDAHHTNDGSTLVNLTRYPIADLSLPAGKAVVAEGRRQLEQTGLCLLPDFVSGTALQAMTAEARALSPRAYHAETWMTGRGDEHAAPLPEPSRNACGAVAYDLLPKDSPVRKLYEWDGLTMFLRQLLQTDSFYPCADPISSCVLMYYNEGDELGWHFDPNDGVVTLLLQGPHEGGAFEFAPRVGQDRTEEVVQLFRGGRDGVVVPDLLPGTLSVFRGENALHRVTRVAGPQPRIMATMSYADRPGMMFSPENRRRYSGREAVTS